MTTIGVLVKAPGFIVFGALLLLLILAKGALADGAYQRTDDRKKTFVWNNNPKPDDTATWSGGRDAEGYATGPGTLQWFRTDRSFTTGSNVFSPKKTLISSYSGTMVHGKFSGGVMTVDHGTTYHATFVDGHMNGRWTAGPVVTKAESAEPAAAAEKPERTASATSTEVASESSKTKKISEEKTRPQVAEETSADIPAAGPEESEVSGQRSKVSKSATASEEPEQSATPRAPVTRKAALAPGAVRAIEHPTHAVAKKSEAEPARRSDRAKPEQTEKSSKIAKAASSQPSKAEAQLSEDIPAEGPLSAEAEKAQSPSSKSAIAESSQPSTTPVDNSLRTLTGPPSSLHLRTPPETNPPAQISTPPIAAVSSPTAGAKLTAVQAMDIADIEARTKGYDLGEYQLPKAEYNAASDTWSVTYVARDAGKAAKKLSVTIQDKTGKAEVKK